MNNINQQIFNRVWLHLMTQDRPSRNASGALALYGTDGTRSAVGCLIRREDYMPGMERLPFTDVTTMAPISRTMGCSIADINPHVLTALEEVHDDTIPALWDEDLKALAITHGLDPQPFPHIGNYVSAWIGRHIRARRDEHDGFGRGV